MQIGLKATCGGHPLNGRRVEGGDKAIRQPHQAQALEGLGQREGVLSGPLTLTPVLQGNEGHAAVADDGIGENVKAREGDHILHMGVGHGDLVELIRHCLGPAHRGGIRQHDGGDEVALIFVWYQFARHFQEEAVDGEDQHGDDGKGDPHPTVQEGHTPHIAAGQLVKFFVEPNEEAGRFVVSLFEQHGTEGRGESQCHQTGDGDRDRDRDGELLVHHPGHAAHKGDRQEHGAEHQHDGDHRTGDFLHGEDGSLLGRALLLAHDPLDVLQHHDGVINHDTDGEHHAEQGQQVDGETEHQHAGEGPDERHRHRDTGDQGGAEVLQEQIDDHEHQYDRLEQGVYHLFDGDLHELGGVVGDLVLDILREALLESLHGGMYRIGNRDGVGARLQIGGNTDGRFAVGAGDQIIILAPQLDPGDIADPDLGAIGHGADDDVLELLHILKAPLGLHRVGEVDGGRGGLGTDLARRELGVLLANGADHVARGELELGQSIRPQPDAHRIVGTAKQGGITDAGNPLELVDDVEQGVVRQIGGIKRAVR